MRPAADWDILSEGERQRVRGEVQVGGYRISIENDTDRLWADLVADLPLQEWGWFLDRLDDRKPSGFSGHVQSIWDLRDKKPCASLGQVDWEILEKRVGEAARGIVQQSFLQPGEIDAFKLYMSFRGREAKKRPHHAYAIGQGGEVLFD
jgi:hypothetical protein